MKTKYDISRDEHPCRLQAIYQILEATFEVVGAKTVGTGMARKFFDKHGLAFNDHDEYTLSDYVELPSPNYHAEVNESLSGASENRLKRSVKIYFVLIPVILFCVSVSFGLVHHFFRYSWAGDIFYLTSLLFVVAIVVELFLITFTK